LFEQVQSILAQKYIKVQVTTPCTKCNLRYSWTIITCSAASVGLGYIVDQLRPIGVGL